MVYSLNKHAFYLIQTRIVSFGFQLILDPFSLWPVLEWNRIFLFFVRQSFNSVYYLFLYLFLVQGIHGPIIRQTSYYVIQYSACCPCVIHPSVVIHTGISVSQFHGYQPLAALERTTSLSSLHVTLRRHTSDYLSTFYYLRSHSALIPINANITTKILTLSRSGIFWSTTEVTREKSFDNINAMIFQLSTLSLNFLHSIVTCCPVWD